MLIESDADIRALLAATRRIAIVGISANAARPSHGVARYLLAAGYDVVPVNPGLREWQGLPCYPNLRAIPGPVGLVDVFRRSEEVPALVDDASAIGAPAMWLQLDIHHDDAVARAIAAGMSVVVDRCTKIEHARLLG